MEMKIPAWTAPAVWGILGGGVGWWIVLASGFGWMSSGAAAKMATNEAQDAVVAYATPACVARFERMPDAVAAWKGLESADSWNRGDLVVSKGWVAEPSQKLDNDTTTAVADA